MRWYQANKSGTWLQDELELAKRLWRFTNNITTHILHNLDRDWRSRQLDQQDFDLELKQTLTSFHDTIQREVDADATLPVNPSDVMPIRVDARHEEVIARLEYQVLYYDEFLRENIDVMLRHTTRGNCATVYRNDRDANGYVVDKIRRNFNCACRDGHFRCLTPDCNCLRD